MQSCVLFGGNSGCRPLFMKMVGGAKRFGMGKNSFGAKIVFVAT